MTEGFSLSRNCSNPKIKGAVVFHDQGPHAFDYSIRLNHTWALKGFPDVKSIMDTNGAYLNDLELGVSPIPIMQYSYSGFLTVYFCVFSLFGSLVHFLILFCVPLVFVLICTYICHSKSYPLGCKLTKKKKVLIQG